MLKFFKETIWRGLFLVLIVGGALVVLHRIIGVVEKVVAPVERHLPIDAAFPNMWAVVLLVLVVFLTGLALRVRAVSRAVDQLEGQLAARIPLFRIVAGVKSDVLDDDGGETVCPALLEDGDKLVPAFFVEETADGWASVFLPESSNPTSGTTAIVPRARVRLLDLPTKQFMKFMKSWGVGSDQVLKSVRKTDAQTGSANLPSC